MSCCDPFGDSIDTVGECPECGGPVDTDGDSTDVCGYSPQECDLCGWAPCDESC